MVTFTPQRQIVSQLDLGNALIRRASQGARSTAAASPIANLLLGISGGMNRSAGFGALQQNQQARQQALQNIGEALRTGDFGAASAAALQPGIPGLANLGVTLAGQGATNRRAQATLGLQQRRVAIAEAEAARKATEATRNRALQQQIFGLIAGDGQGVAPSAAAPAAPAAAPSAFPATVPTAPGFQGAPGAEPATAAAPAPVQAGPGSAAAVASFSPTATAQAAPGGVAPQAQPPQALAQPGAAPGGFPGAQVPSPAAAPAIAAPTPALQQPAAGQQSSVAIAPQIPEAPAARPGAFRLDNRTRGLAAAAAMSGDMAGAARIIQNGIKNSPQFIGTKKRIEAQTTQDVKRAAGIRGSAAGARKFLQKAKVLQQKLRELQRRGVSLDSIVGVFQGTDTGQFLGGVTGGLIGSGNVGAAQEVNQILRGMELDVAKMELKGQGTVTEAERRIAREKLALMTAANAKTFTNQISQMVQDARLGLLQAQAFQAGGLEAVDALNVRGAIPFTPEQIRNMGPDQLRAFRGQTHTMTPQQKGALLETIERLEQ